MCYTKILWRTNISAKQDFSIKARCVINKVVVTVTPVAIRSCVSNKYSGTSVGLGL